MPSFFKKIAFGDNLLRFSAPTNRYHFLRGKEQEICQERPAFKISTPYLDFYSVFLIIIFIFFIAFRFKYIFSNSLQSDEGLYAWFGKRIFDAPHLIFSEDMSSWHPPLFSLFLALAHILLPSELACRFISFVFSILGIYTIYVLGMRLKNKFVGSFAAMTLATNIFYLYISTRILIDIPLVVFCIVLALVLWGVNEKNSMRTHLWVGFWGCLILFLKWSAVMIFPWILAYYLLGIERASLWERVRKSFIPLSMIASFSLLWCIKNIFQLNGKIFPVNPPIDFIHYKNLGEQINNLVLSLQFPMVFILFVFGFLGLFKEEKRKVVLLFAWFLFFFWAIITISVVDVRYYQPLLPCILLIAGIGLERIIGYFSKILHLRWDIRPLILVIFFGLEVMSFYRYKHFIEKFTRDYVGYDEAGGIVRTLAGPDSLILAGSERQIRYYSGINYKEYGGQIIPFRHSKEDMEKFLQMTKQKVILEIDIWEKLQPRWVFNEEGLEYLFRQGFRIVKVVERLVDEKGNRRVAMILERDARL